MVAGRHALVLLWMVTVTGFGQTASSGVPLGERLVARIPVGPAPGQISDQECSGREGFCSAGFAFAGEGDTLYFYDLFHDNLKVLAPSRAEPVGLLPGLGADRADGGRPVDGFRGADGFLYLTTSSGGSRGREQTWRREPGGEWRRAPRPAEWSALDARASRLRGPADPSRGIFLGADGAGNRYYEKRGSWASARLEMYDAGDRLIAASELPERPIWKPVSGRGEKWVSPRGGVYEVYVSERWLVISRWTAG